MLASAQRLAVRVRRRERLGPMLLVSVALHLTLLLSFLFILPTPPATEASGAPSVEVMTEEGTPEGEQLPTPSFAPPTEVPTEAMPPTPPVPQTEMPPPTPAPMPVPTESTEVAALEPPPPAPAPPPPPPPPVATPQPPAPPHAAARPAPRPATARVNSKGAPAHAQDGDDPSSPTSGGSHGNGWVGKLKQWWDAHSFYPPEASQLDEGGNVKVHITIAPDGAVTAIRVVQGSGSTVLDEAALAVFRNAHLPPFPPGTPPPPGDLEVSLHYVPAHKGG